MVTVRVRSASVSGSHGGEDAVPAVLPLASSAARVAGGSTNSLSRLRFGFSPSVVRKSVQRERMLPAMCFTMIAIELASLSRTAKSCSSVTCSIARSAELFVVSEDGERVLDIRRGELERHADSVAEPQAGKCASSSVSRREGLIGALAPNPASNPAIEMSSSIASQCRPRLLILTRSSSSEVQRNSLGNQASGTPIVRPSLSSTHMLSASKRTRVALTEELIPCLLDRFPVCLNNPQYLAKSAGIVAIIVGHSSHWLHPEFRLIRIFLNMDVHRLPRRSFIRIEEESESIFDEYRWHWVQSIVARISSHPYGSSNTLSRGGHRKKKNTEQNKPLATRPPTIQTWPHTHTHTRRRRRIAGGRQVDPGQDLQAVPLVAQPSRLKHAGHAPPGRAAARCQAGSVLPSPACPAAARRACQGVSAQPVPGHQQVVLACVALGADPAVADGDRTAEGPAHLLIVGHHDHCGAQLPVRSLHNPVTSAPERWSSWLVGSSASSSRGPLASATATASRCCSPPDSLAAGRAAS